MRISTGEIVFQHDCIADLMASMGNLILPDPGMPKPAGEWLLSGSFFSAGQTPVPGGQVSVEIAGQKKTLNVFGDREWLAGIPSSPVPVSSVPLIYEFAFGGPDYADNPIGKGHSANQLPNIELAGQTIGSNSKAYVPAGFGPYDPSWPDRARYQGTYNQRYLETSYPGYPKDMDWRLFMTAPADQQLKQFWRGDESFGLHNMHPERPLITSSLPDLKVRAFVLEKNGDASPAFSETDLHLDTLWFFPDKDIVQMIWRGGMLVDDDEATQISHLLVAYESNKDEPRSVAHYQQAMEKRIHSPQPMADNLNTADLIPLGQASAMQMLMTSALAGNTDQPLADNIKVKSEKLTQLVNEHTEKSRGEAIKNLADSGSDEKTIEAVKKQLEGKTSGGETDPDLIRLKENMEKILPGIMSGKAENVDLSDFSFASMDDLFAELQSFSEKKKDAVKLEVENAVKRLNQEFDKADGEGLNEEYKESIKAQIKTLQDLLQDKNVIVPLARIDVDDIRSKISANTPEIQKAEQELHLMLANPVFSDPSKVQTVKDNLVHLRETEFKNIAAQVEEARNSFFEANLMAAHYSQNGLSPHSDDETQKQKLIHILNNNRDASQQDWACLDLSGMNLDGVNFSGCLMEQVNLKGASLKGADLSRTVLARSNLAQANFTGANLESANIGACDCTGTVFDDAQLIDTKLSRSMLYGTSFRQAKLINPETLELKAEHCDFSYAFIQNFPFIQLDLKQLTFEYAQLKNCSFVDCDISACRFDHATIPSTAWANTSLSHCSFSQANMTSNCFVTSDTEDAGIYSHLDFSGADLTRCNFQKLNLSGTVFAGSTLEGANFSGANLSHANMDGVVAPDAVFRNANLNYTSMIKADLMQSMMSKAIITNTNLESANLYAVDFIKAVVNNTRFNGANLDASVLKDWRPS
ncbi:MAG: hypothetical protein CMI13_01940 [Oleibacter sp.]|nr:hypothetical protein [Thalassolituus sp.]